MFVNNTAFFGLLILSGANIAIEKLPLVIQKISYALPLTRGINAARAIVAGTPIEEIIPMMSIEKVIVLHTLHWASYFLELSNIRQRNVGHLM